MILKQKQIAMDKILLALLTVAIYYQIKLITLLGSFSNDVIFIVS